MLQLLKSRRVLKCSYVYGYYLEETGYKKPIFEFMQTELEECTESLSEMIARPYLRTPRHKIIQVSIFVSPYFISVIGLKLDSFVNTCSYPHYRATCGVTLVQKHFKSNFPVQ